MMLASSHYIFHPPHQRGEQLIHPYQPYFPIHWYYQW